MMAATIANRTKTGAANIVFLSPEIRIQRLAALNRYVIWLDLEDQAASIEISVTKSQL